MTFDDSQEIVLNNSVGEYKGERSRLRRAIEVIAEAVDCTHEEVMEVAYSVCICGQCGYNDE
jgi:hypothetical protein